MEAQIQKISEDQARQIVLSYRMKTAHPRCRRPLIVDSGNTYVYEYTETGWSIDRVLSVREGSTEDRDGTLSRYYGFRPKVRRPRRHCWLVCVGHEPEGFLCGRSTIIWVDQKTGKVVQTAFDGGG